MIQYFSNKTYKDPQSKINIITNEGAEAVYEAINYLKSVEKAPPAS